MDRPIKNIAWLAAASILEALQWTIIVALFFSFIPIPYDDFFYTFFPFMQKGVLQKRDVLFYHIFLSVALILQFVLISVYLKTSGETRLMRPSRSWIAMSVILLIPEAFLIYQYWLGDQPQLARQALVTVCALALAARIFWREVYAWLQGSNKRHFPNVKLSRLRSIKALWHEYQGAVIVILLIWAFCVQAFLFVFLLRGWFLHAAVWPSGNPWNYVALGVLCLTAAAVGVPIARARGMLDSADRRYGLRTCVEGVLTYLLLNALFEIHVYAYQPQLAQKAYGLLLAIAFGIKLGWRGVDRSLRVTYGLLTQERHQAKIKAVAAAAFIVFIFLFIYVPDLESAIARMFMGEQLHSVDVTLMNTAWAYKSGCKLNLDINNRYGLGWAVMVSQLTGLLGGFSYHNVLALVMFGCIVYFIGAFCLLRWWLNSVPLAMAGILMFLKMQTFREETASIVLTNPTETVCRYFFDLPFLFLTLLFLRTFKKAFLIAAALSCAVALFYEADTGTYLSAAYYALLIMIYSFKDTRAKVYSSVKDIRLLLTLVLIPPLGMLGLLRLTQGPGVFTLLFWNNMTHYVRSYLWNGPYQIWGVLREHEWWLFGMGAWIIVAYVFTLLYIGSLVYLRKTTKDHFFICVLCVYGLVFYHYHVFHTTATNCYRGIMPYVFILCFWLQEWAKGLSKEARKKLYLALLGGCLYALFTTHLTTAYPNVLNMSRNPSVDPAVAIKQSQGKLAYFNFLFIQYPDAFKLPKNDLGETFEDWRTEDDFKTDEQLKAYYHQEFNFSEDAALIDRLTGPGDPVPLISSFEIKMLMQANRKPFFYIFPLVNSRPMRMRLFEVTHMWTTTELDETIKQLEDRKPQFVFMERIYLADAIPASFLYDMPAVCMLDSYVRQHYEPYAYGKYLVAMKLKPS